MAAMRSRDCLRISSRRRGMTLDFLFLSLNIARDSATRKQNDTPFPVDRAPRTPAPDQSLHGAYGTGRCARPARPLRSTLPRPSRPRAGSAAALDRRRKRADLSPTGDREWLRRRLFGIAAEAMEHL